jgi:two-component system NtrC family response regulator
MSLTRDTGRDAAAILVADPDLAFARRTASLLRQAGHRTEACAGGPRLLRALAGPDSGFDLVLADFASVDPALRARPAAPDAPALVLLSGFGSVEDEVAALRSGAFDFLTKPIDEEQLVLVVARAIGARGLARENARLRADLSERHAFGSVVTRDPAMRRVLEVAESLAGTRATILIEGESGTGKTMLARAIHEHAARTAPFVEVTCGALPSSLLESELFGHARGAFTGALRDRPGKFEAADGGTLFLDEIGNAPLDLQQKLLRVLQDKSFERLGETRTRTVDVRVIAATNEDLAAAVQAGRFREDLLWRVRVVALSMPPLRERRGDVPILAEHFLERFRAEHGRPGVELDPACLPLLAAQPWRGNVRELEHCLERAGPARARPEDRPRRPRPRLARRRGRGGLRSRRAFRARSRPRPVPAGPVRGRAAAYPEGGAGDPRARDHPPGPGAPRREPRGDRPDAERESEHAVQQDEEARPHGHPPLPRSLVALRMNRGGWALLVGSAALAAAVAAMATREIARSPEEELRGIEERLERGRIDREEALYDLDRLVDHTLESGDPRFVAKLRLSRGRLLMDIAAWDRAREDLRIALGLASSRTSSARRPRMT